MVYLDTTSYLPHCVVSGDRNQHLGHSKEPAAAVCAALCLLATSQQTIFHHPQQAAQAGPHRRIPGKAENLIMHSTVGISLYN